MIEILIISGFYILYPILLIIFLELSFKSEGWFND